MMTPKTKEELIADLRSHKCRIVFKKKDDTLRTMICTLREDMLPSREVETSKKSSNERVLPVWDVEKNSWRSFRLDSVIDFRKEEENEG